MRILIACMITAVSAIYTGAGTAPNGEAYRDTPFLEEFNGQEIDTAVWEIGTWAEHGGQTGKERCFVKDGMLHMLFINDPDQGYLNAALLTREEFLYGTWEARIRPTDVPGVLNSFYTIDWDNMAVAGSKGAGTKQEIDVELLTKSFGAGKGRVHCALHAAGKKSWESEPDFDLGFNPSDDFHVFGYTVMPEYVEWSVDGKPIHRYTYAGNPIAITAPYSLKLNVWSAEKWIEGPPEPGVVCTYLIDWIKFTPLKK